MTNAQQHTEEQPTVPVTNRKAPFATGFLETISTG